MQFRDLNAQYEALKNKIDPAVAEVMQQGNFISGQQVRSLEKDLAAYVGMKHCITCANGTDALTLALMAWKVGPGDAVFVPDFTFFASGEVVSLTGATPIFVDVDCDTFNMDPDKLEHAIQQTLKQGELTPKAVIAVDLFGLPADFSAIRKITEQYRLLVLEDGAQGFGGSIGGKKACSFGDISTTSFFPAKPLGCYGDGGAVFTNDDDIAAYMASVCVHGKGSFKYDNVRIGMNSRLDTMQAAILQVKLEAFKTYELEQINEAAARYTTQLNAIVKTPKVSSPFYSSWAQYTLTLASKEQRDALQASLKEDNIPSMVYYPKPMHTQTAFQDIAQFQTAYPVTEMLCDCVLSLPMHPYLTKKEVNFICEKIKAFIEK